MHPDKGQLCERARQWSSLRVDGELSQLESALLDAHLDSCGACREFTAGIEAVSGALRAAGLVPLPAPLLVRARRRRGPAVTTLAAAAAMFAALALGATLGVDRLNGRAGVPKPTAMIASGDSETALRNIRRAQLIALAHPIPRNKALF